VLVSIASPLVLPSSIWPESRHPHWSLRGLLGLHTRYGPPDRRRPKGRPCREAPPRPVTRPSRSPAFRPIDNCLC